MKVVNIIGGLGNQMFQYAFAVALQKRFADQSVKINTSCFRGYPLHNGFELDRIFNVGIPVASVSDLMKVAYPWVHYRLWQVGRRLLPRRKSMTDDKDFIDRSGTDMMRQKSYFDGYWQSPRFFEDYREEIVREFRFPEITDADNKKALDFIGKDKTAFIHVRRGDYVNHKIFGGICSLDYYKGGIDILKNEYGIRRFVVFSNDMKWCEDNLTSSLEDCDIMFVDWNHEDRSYLDMALMSKCDAALISNSSFSWWGAWLADTDIVLCPERWTNIIGHHDDIYPANWKKIRI